MDGGGPFHLPAGAWTDDTSMAMCLATSLVECGKFDLRDQIERYCRWYEHGYLSSTGRCFDIGNATREALHRYRQTVIPEAGSTDPLSAATAVSCGSPRSSFLRFPMNSRSSIGASEFPINASSRECLDACRLMSDILSRALAGRTRQETLFNFELENNQSSKLKEHAREPWQHKAREQIRGKRHVIQSLEAALCVLLEDGQFSRRGATSGELR